MTKSEAVRTTEKIQRCRTICLNAAESSMLHVVCFIDAPLSQYASRALAE